MATPTDRKLARVQTLIRNTREAGISQATIAALAGVSTSTVHDYLQGTVTAPNPTTCRRIAQACRSAMDELQRAAIALRSGPSRHDDIAMVRSVLSALRAAGRPLSPVAIQAGVPDGMVRALAAGHTPKGLTDAMVSRLLAAVVAHADVLNRRPAPDVSKPVAATPRPPAPRRPAAHRAPSPAHPWRQSETERHEEMRARYRAKRKSA